MSLGRNHSGDNDVRDVKDDYIKAYLAEHERAVAYGRGDLAAAVAKELRALGHEIKGPATGTKERAVSPGPPEKAVEVDTPPKRRGRPAAAKTAE